MSVRVRTVAPRASLYTTLIDVNLSLSTTLIEHLDGTIRLPLERPTAAAKELDVLLRNGLLRSWRRTMSRRREINYGMELATRARRGGRRTGFNSRFDTWSGKPSRKQQSGRSNPGRCSSCWRQWWPRPTPDRLRTRFVVVPSESTGSFICKERNPATIRRS